MSHFSKMEIELKSMIAIEEEKYFQSDDKADRFNIEQRQKGMIDFFMKIKMHKKELASKFQVVEKMERIVSDYGEGMGSAAKQVMMRNIWKNCMRMHAAFRKEQRTLQAEK